MHLEHSSYFMEVEKERERLGGRYEEEKTEKRGRRDIWGHVS
jgi:hypothetical protein